MPYVLPTKAIDPSLVGDSYHLALGMTSPGQPSPDRIFGYLLAEGTTFEQLNDIKSRDAIVQNASPNLIDRDLVSTPRVSQGDFSGGALQLNWLDAIRYWDSDLDVRTPGYLRLAPAWARGHTANAGGVTLQCVAYMKDVYTVEAGSGLGGVFDPFGNAYATGIVPTLIDTDGDRLYVADGVNTVRQSNSLDPTIWSTVSAAIGAIKQMWVINQGTAGRFIYYTLDNRTLLKYDLAAAVGGIAVPLGGAQYTIVDLCAWEAGIAVVTKDPGETGFDVWIHDGATLQRMVRVNQYIPSGITLALGQLYVTARSTGALERPVLIRLGSGSYEIVVRIGGPGAPTLGPQVGAPISSGQYVHFALHFPMVTSVSAYDYIGTYDVETGAYWHLGNLDSSDAPSVTQPRQLGASGRAVAFPMMIGSVGWIQYQVNSGIFPPLPQVYQASGWLLSSRIDFATPGIEKLMRRVLVHHAALLAGEQLQVNAYVDIPDLSTISTATTPTGTATNSVVGSTTTVLTLPQRTIGFDLIFGLKLTAGTGQATSPTVYYVSVEISVSWTWQFTLDCSSRRQLLNGTEDQQGLRAKDLVMLIQNAWENALPLTLYHPNGLSYNCVIENARFETENPINILSPEHAADLEGRWVLTLRDAVA